MDQVIKYWILTVLLVLSTFEFFFRESILCNIFLCICIFIAFYRHIKFNIFTFGLICLISIVLVGQACVNKNTSLIGALNLLVPIVGSFSVAYIIKRDFVPILTNIITVIAAYSLIIYILTLYNPIGDFFYDNLTPYFPSLNVENAVFEEGGRNIVIYNFYRNFVSEVIGFRRNCGPFWEPGMFAVYLNLALIFNLILIKGSWKKNLLFVLTIITTFSTGGILTLFYILIGYISLKKGSGFSIILLLLLIILGYQLLQTEFIGIKLLDQMDNYEVGDDSSRFGAFFTQINMISDHPILGGGQIADYAKYSKTLASGLLMPIVDYGLLVGPLIYLAYFISCYNLTPNGGKMKNAVFIFSCILLMSFSQTILNTAVFSTFMFTGLILVTYDKI